jgi:hypothetical protein
LSEVTKNVTLILTYHTDETWVVSKRGKQNIKPKYIMYYNQHMDGVNLKDQLLQPNLGERNA